MNLDQGTFKHIVPVSPEKRMAKNQAALHGQMPWGHGLQSTAEEDGKGAGDTPAATSTQKGNTR
jgi:hypothetical protein